MIIILERFNALVPLFMTFRFQLYIIYNFSKIRSGRALLLPMRSCSSRTLPTIKKFVFVPQFMFNSGDTLRIIFSFLTQMCTKRLVNIRVKFWKNILTGV